MTSTIARVRAWWRGLALRTAPEVYQEVTITRGMAPKRIGAIEVRCAERGALELGDLVTVPDKTGAIRDAIVVGKGNDKVDLLLPDARHLELGVPIAAVKRRST